MHPRRIPFNRAHATGMELRYIEDAIAATQLSGNGPFSARCTAWLEERTGTARALLTHSCTGALEMATLLAGIGPGDEVIMPSFTFVSTANAVALRGATPVFVDIRDDTLNIDERLVEAAITPRTRAIMPVHYAGIAAEMDALLELARAHRLAVIEDAAQGICATYKGRPLGGIGDFGALSFHETKNLMCGEGGALLVNGDSAIGSAEIVHEKGTNRSAFFRGQVDKYTWVEVGSSFLLSEINAAFLWAQLERAEEIIAKRQAVWGQYHTAFADGEARGQFRRPVVPRECSHNGHLYYLLLPTGRARDAALAGLNAAGVNAVFHYIPLHTAPAGRRLAKSPELPVTDYSAQRLLRLPLWPDMTEDDVAYVVATVERVLAQNAVRV